MGQARCSLLPSFQSNPSPRSPTMSARPLLRPLCQPHTDLLERSEAYLAAVDLWASRGNAQTLANAVGSGKINVVAALAAKRCVYAAAPKAEHSTRR